MQDAELWVATTNQGKVKEVKTLFEAIPFIKVKSLSDMSYYTPPKETGKTFLENAQIKSRALRAVKPGAWILADDSGLEAEGLGGFPGVHSARYAGDKASDSENNAKLLKMIQLRSAQNRSAQFKCALSIYTPEGQEWTFEGVLKGAIGLSEKGKFGFGYDSVFIPDGQTQTLAELGMAFKNRVSHRAQAIGQFVKKLSERG